MPSPPCPYLEAAQLLSAVQRLPAKQREMILRHTEIMRIMALPYQDNHDLIDAYTHRHLGEDARDSLARQIYPAFTRSQEREQACILYKAAFRTAIALREKGGALPKEATDPQTGTRFQCEAMPVGFQLTAEGTLGKKPFSVDFK